MNRSDNPHNDAQDYFNREDKKDEPILAGQCDCKSPVYEGFGGMRLVGTNKIWCPECVEGSMHLAFIRDEFTELSTKQKSQLINELKEV